MNINDRQREVITALGSINADAYQGADDGSVIFFWENKPESTHESLLFWKQHISRLVVWVSEGRPREWGIECAYPNDHFHGSWSHHQATTLGLNVLGFFRTLASEYDIVFEVRDIKREQETA